MGNTSLKAGIPEGPILFHVFIGLSTPVPNGHKIHKRIPETSIE
jgi:hypothetical protein